MPYIGRELDRGNYLKLDDISSSFNGSTTSFNLTNGGKAFYPGSAFSILVVLAGVIQEPEAAYQINQAQITFASAPLAGDQFFCIVLGQALGVNTPANGSVNGTQLAKPFNYDNYFYLDDANNRVGVGTATPMTPLHVEGTGRFTDLTVTGDLTVEGTTTTLDTVVTEVDKLEVGANNSTVGVAITQSGSGRGLSVDGDTVISHTGANPLDLYKYGTSAPTILMYGANGTQASPTQTLSGDVIGGLNMFGYGSSDWAGGPSVRINAIASENNGQTSNRGADIKFETVATGGTSLQERLRITSDGFIGISNTSPGLQSSAARNLVIGTPGSGGQNGLTICSNTSGTNNIYFGDASSGQGESMGRIVYSHADDSLRLHTVVEERLRIASDGKVGIGTDDPQSQFEVYGSSPIIRSKHSTSQKYTQINHDGTDGYLDWSSGQLIFRGASNTERLRIRSDGKLMTQSAGYVYTASSAGSLSLYGGNTNLGGGIVLSGGNTNGDIRFYAQMSTATPAERLRITSGGGLKFISADSPTSTTEPAQILNHSGGWQFYGSSGTSTHRNIIFCTASNAASERLRITSSGELLLGATSTTNITRLGQTFAIASTDSFGGMSISGFTGTTGYEGPVIDLQRSRATSKSTGTVVVNNDRLGSLVFRGDDGTDFADAAYMLGEVDGTPNGGFVPGRFAFYTGTASATPVERLRIASDGQIGMGKAGAVTVNGNSPLTIQESDSNSETICLRATNSSGNGSQPGIVMKTAAGGHIGGIYCDVNSDYMRLSTSGNDAIYISNAGDVGIGYATPSQKLVVKGTTSLMATNSTNVWMAYTYTDNTFRLNYNGAGADEVTITSDGKVGVGADSPLNLFHVKGTNTIARFQSTTSYVDVMFQNTGATNGFIQYNNSGNFNFYANSGSTPTLTITAGAPGNVIVGSTTAQAHANMDDLQVGGGSGNRGITISSGTSNYGTVAFGDSADGSGTDRYEGFIEYYHNDNSMRLGTVHSERVRITSDGSIGVGAHTPVTDVDISQKTGAVALPQGTTAQRPSGSAPYIRKNTTNNALEFYNGTEWVEIITDYFPTGSTILG